MESETANLPALTAEEDAEFRRIGRLPVGEITVDEWRYYHDLVEKVLDGIAKVSDGE